MILKFAVLARSLHLPVTGAVLIAKSESLRHKYGLSEEDFKASRGWVARFCRRNGIDNAVRLWGDAGSVDKEKLRDEMIEFCKKLQRNKPDRIYNQDGTGFMYQLLPNVS